MPSGLEKYMSFNFNNKLAFIDSFQFLSTSVDSLVKKLGKNDFKYLIQEFDIDVLDVVKQKGFYPYEHMGKFEKFKEEWPSKEKIYGLLTVKRISDKEYEHVVKVWDRFKVKTMKDYHCLYLKFHVYC